MRLYLEVARRTYRQWLRFDRDEVTASELLTRVTAKAEVRDLSVEEPDIESIVREIYRR